MTDAITLSRYIIHSFNENGCVITNLKLQKILYYVQGYFLKKFDKPAFSEEIYKWQYGPVVPVAYYEYNSHHDGGLEYSKNVDLNVGETQKGLVDKVIDSCLRKTATKLVSMTHMESPWIDSVMGERISNKSIQSFFAYKNPLEIDL